ncbi:MAG TPA: ParB N-terminal domain-containing protein [bacterium]|nr:ParB N-terminal domain-containing protein [bacterium]
MPTLHKILIQQIALSPLFQTRFQRDDRELASSIQTHGLLIPPVLWQNEAGSFFIIDGAARLACASAIKQEAVACQVMSCAEMNRQQAFVLCLELNRWCRAYNIVEKALLFKQAKNLFAEIPNIPPFFWHAVGIKPHYKIIYQYQNLLKLPDLVLTHAITNDIPINVVITFLKFPPQEQQRIASQLFILPINQNKLGEMLDSLNDISKQEGTQPSEALEQTLRALPGHLTPLEKVQSLRDQLNTRRRPHLIKHQKQFDQSIKKLPLTENTKICPSPFFEDDYIQLTAKLTTQEDVTRLEELLKKIEIDDYLYRP